MQNKLHALLCTVFMVCLSANIHAQANYAVRLKARTIAVAENKNLAKADFENLQTAQTDKTADKAATPYIYGAVAALQFYSIPTEKDKALLSANGIALLSYLGGNTYWCSVSTEKLLRKPTELNIRNIVQMRPTDKMTAALAVGDVPRHARAANDMLLVAVRVHDFGATVAQSDVWAYFKKNNIEIIENTAFANKNTLTARIAQADLARLAEMPMVAYIAPIPAPPAEINDRERSALTAAFVARPSGLNLTGSGVIVGVGDGGDINHIDYNTRADRKAGQPVSSHATHVTGTITSAGVINPRYKGMAPGIPLVISDYFDAVLTHTPEYMTNFNMSLTNNSWGATENICAFMGEYTSASADTDEQLRDNPKLLHVFAAGNSGGNACIVSGGTNFGNVQEHYQSSKNILAVGNTNDNAVISSGSSKGPTLDGRLKPEIAAIGTGIVSTGTTNNTYTPNSGTSMACPGVTGGLALVSEAYKNANAGVLPDGALLKAIAMNTARDLGNVGPDYSYGYGWLDVRRAVATVTNNTIFANSVAHAATQTHNITVPVGAKQLRVLVYWHDPEAAPAASPALVNNLDMTVTTPSASTVLPWILNPAVPSAVATQGVDNLNNQEQVTIDAPAAGVYTINIVGTNVPMASPQNYYVVYEIIQPEITVLYPVGDEKLGAGQSEIIRWEANDNSANTFTVEYTTDNGGTWTTIDAAVASTDRQLTWILPSIASEQCRIRVKRNSTATADESDANFTVIGVPTITITKPCTGYATITWTAITGATDYEIFSIDRTTATVTSIGTTALLTFTRGGLVSTQTYDFAVTARTATVTGRRSAAVAVMPNSGACTDVIHDNNMELTSINVNNGRIFTSSALTNVQTVTFTMRNRDDVAYTGTVTATYQVNGGAVVSQNFAVAALGVGNSRTLTFTTKANLSAVNTYTINGTIAATGDTETSNDTKTIVVRQVDNPVLTLPIVETFEGASTATYTANTFAATGIDRLDYNTTPATSLGRLRTAVLPNLAHAGSKAMTMDARQYQATPTSVNEGILTFNLSGVTAANLRMDFYFQHHNDETHPGDKVWIRGNDAATWLQAYDLYANQGAPNTYNVASAVNIKSILTAGGQVPSSSFQVKFGQEGNTPQSLNASGDGYTFDDIKIYDLMNDLAVKTLDAPVACAAGGNVVTITLENTALTNIVGASLPISYTITPPVGAPTNVSEMVNVTLNTGATMPFSFTTPYAFSQTGEYTIKVELTNVDDVLPNNTLTQYRAVNQGTISSFPYTEGFESGTGNWYHSGTNDDWTLGTPAKTIINKAANGTKAWVTKTTGDYSPAQVSYLYTPCFDLTTLTNPIVSFSFIHDLEFCPNPSPCDFVVLQYSTDGKTWTKLGAQGDAGSTKWHNDAVQGWSNTDGTWHVASLPIPAAAKTALTRFRFLMQSDTYVNQEGAAIDDFSIFEQQTIYSAANTTVTQAVSGSNWVNFSSGGNVIAQINPQGNNLGSTGVSSFIFGGALRNANNQYYMDRNLVITPTNTPNSPVKVRIFFLKAEIDEAINGTGCGTCTAPTDAYVLGVTKFSGSPASYENGDISDNFGHGTTTFILPANTHIQPYDNGYFAEFSVSSFSEFSLNHGGASGTAPLPVELSAFDARKQNKNALLTWTTESEKNCNYFEVETTDAQGISNSNFKKIGEVRANGTTNTRHEYNFTDERLDKNGTLYYRLRIVDFDGTNTFSAVRSLKFSSDNTWALYPNPTNGTFKTVFAASAQSSVTLTLTNALGQTIVTRTAMATGSTQTIVFDDLATAEMSSGVYFITIATEGRTETLRLMKE